MTTRDVPNAVKRVVVGVAVAGAACLALGAHTSSAESFAGWLKWLSVIVIVVAGELAVVRIRTGGTSRSHNWRESALILGFVLLPPGQLILAMTVSEVLAMFIRRSVAIKVLFNTALVAIEASLVVLTASSVHVDRRGVHWDVAFDPRTMTILILATLAAPACALFCTSAVIAAERGRSMFIGISDVLRTSFTVWLRNVAAACVIMAALAWSPIVTAVVGVVLLGVHVFTAERAAMRQERFAWHRLQEAIDQLRDVELDSLVADATVAAATMMRADAAEIRINAQSGYMTVQRASDIEEAHVPAPDEKPPGHSMDVPLTTHEGRIGELRLLFTQPVKLTDAEHNCLTAFANALAVALANALKFDAIREEADRRIKAAYVDPVTGVGNLLLLEQESRTVLPANDTGDLAAVAVIGLNRFAEVNDLLGAHAADQMLRAVATRLTSVVRRCDVVARLHGAEYVLLFRELPSESAAVAQAESAVRALGRAITADGLDLTVDAHAGVACAPHDGIELDDLVRRARLAMYKARSDDVPVFRYQPELEPPALAQVELLRDLRQALSERQLILHFQPKFGLRGGLPVAAEALVRWRHPERGMIPPAEFIPLLERCGLVGDLTRYVLEASIEECAEWHKMGLPLSVAVNLSARNLLDEDLPRFVLECLSRHRLPTDRLICEITETAVFSRSPIAASVLDQLRAAGVGLSLDDFCTGYSSLSLLRERTIDEIKIDRSFVADLGVEARATQIVTTLIELAHRCDILVTAEGIETPEQQQLLTTLGCDQAQGFLLARPMPADDVRRFFAGAMKNAPVMPLPRQPHGKLRPVTRIASWDDPASWGKASSD